jgi:hypothetical protein
MLIITLYMDGQDMITFYSTRMSCQNYIYTVSHPFADFPGGKQN